MALASVGHDVFMAFSFIVRQGKTMNAAVAARARQMPAFNDILVPMEKFRAIAAAYERRFRPSGALVAHGPLAAVALACAGGPKRGWRPPAACPAPSHFARAPGRAPSTHPPDFPTFCAPLPAIHPRPRANWQRRRAAAPPRARACFLSLKM